MVISCTNKCIDFIAQMLTNRKIIQNDLQLKQKNRLYFLLQISCRYNLVQLHIKLMRMFRGKQKLVEPRNHIDPNNLYTQIDPKYQLQVILSQDKQSLAINIICLQGETIKQIYNDTLKNQTLDQTIKGKFLEVDNIFECFKAKDGHKIDPQRGIVTISSNIEIKGKIKIKSCAIVLNKVQFVANEKQKPKSIQDWEKASLIDKFDIIEERLKSVQLENQRLRSTLHRYDANMEIFKQKILKQAAIMIKKQISKLSIKENLQNPVQEQKKQMKQEQSKMPQQDININISFDEQEQLQQEKIQSQQNNYKSQSLNNPYAKSIIKSVNSKEEIPINQFNFFADEAKQEIATQIKAVKQKSEKEINELKKVINEKIFDSSKKAMQGAKSGRNFEQVLPKIRQSFNNLQYSTCFTPLRTRFVESFIFKGPYVRYNGRQNNWTQCILNEQHKTFHCNVFSIKIIKSQYNNIRVGIVDVNSRYEQQSSANSWQALSLEGSTGRVFGVKDKRMSPFKAGDIIEILYNQKNVQICIQNKSIKTLYFPKVDDPQRKFSPYIEMKNTGDMVQFLYW